MMVSNKQASHKEIEIFIFIYIYIYVYVCITNTHHETQTLECDTTLIQNNFINFKNMTAICYNVYVQAP